ncbi:ATP-binding cassette domain-containing protein [Microbacterium esteraromaticum]|uniref:ATP-binding cassette domain-containing protein n=1 Tax=Microbacterium esteraromaticum TaxID=57043 RepID=A0A7D7WCR5_9MICO|nr:ATP-binding cassette domain-containing protein [Microbacterium esteraromaticum]QMU97057.1 ATP-binding cassette domain-containing protein [Microbacterium esteraromaticum]
MATDLPAIVEFRHVTKRFRPDADERPALDDVSLSIRPGEIFGIIGESGAGKSTLLELINGLTRPTDGDVVVRGETVADLDRAGLRALRRDVGVVFQGVHLLSNSTVRDNVRLPLRLARATRSKGQQDAVDEILSFVGLSHRADHYPAQLSGGERQRVGLARALVARPPLLLCDEPTSSLDASTTADVLRVLADAREKLGTTVVVITHDLDVVKAICDRAALLEKGRLREIFEIDAAGPRSLPSYYEQVKRELTA